MRYLIFILLSFFSFGLLAQSNQTLSNKAALLYSYEEYDMAKALYDSLHNAAPNNLFFLMKLGDCNLNLSKPYKALNYYHNCMKISPAYHQVFFNMASAYDRINLTDSAIYFFKRHLKTNPTDINTNNRIAILYLSDETGTDSAIHYAQKAIALDPNNSDGYYTLAMVYIKLERYEDAIYTSKSGLKNNENAGLLYMPIGMAYHFMENFKASKEAFQKGWEFPELKKVFIHYYANSIVLANTKEEDFKTLANIISKYYPKNVRKKSSAKKDYPLDEYSYSILLSKFRHDHSTFGIKEYAGLYYGFSEDVFFKPYKNTEKLSDLFNNNLDENFIVKASARLDSIPVDFPLYLYLSKSNNFKEDYSSQLNYLISYYGFLEVVKHSGTGMSTEDAIKILYPEHYRELLSSKSLQVLSEAIIQEDSHLYQSVNALDYRSNKVKVFFNIDLAFKTIKRKSK